MSQLSLNLVIAQRAVSEARMAVIDPQRSYTYGQLAGCVERVAGALSRLGVGPGDRVVHLGTASAVHTVLLFASARVKALYAPLDPFLMPASVDALLRRLDPKLLVLGRSLVDRPFADDFDATRRAASGRLTVIDTLSDEWQHLLASGSPATASATLDDTAGESPVLLLFSSGTTGEPKGIVFTQEALVQQALVNDLGLGIGPHDRYLNVYQPSHYGGITCSVQTAAAGACLVVLPVPHPELVLRCIEDERITIVVAVPQLWRKVLRRPEAETTDFTSLRMANVASDFIPKEMLVEIMDRLGAVSVQGYGLSEHGLVTLLPAAEARSRLGSAGLPLPLAAVRIRREDGSNAPPGEDGDIWVRTAFASAGIWTRNGLEPHAADGTGFSRTGDVGRVDEDGHLYVSGRSDDFMKVNGYRVSPAEIESVLLRHPLVKDVAVFAETHATWGQAPVAVLVTASISPTSTELNAKVARELMPQAAFVRFAVGPSIDRTETGKVRRTAMRERFRRGEFASLPD
jgi:acyl-coenzyme A synthetase/AMP-(fatty) acid ligase